MPGGRRTSAGLSVFLSSSPPSPLPSGPGLAALGRRPHDGAGPAGERHRAGPGPPPPLLRYLPGPQPLRAVRPAMGLCLPCMGGAVKDVVETPDPEIKRRQLAEAAEKRQMEASSRGIKNAYSVEQKKKKQEEMEKRMTASGSGGGGLRWQVG